MCDFRLKIGKLFRWTVLTAALVTLVAVPLASGAGRLQAENYVKAAYLLNFARFVKWPASVFVGDRQDIFVLGIFGHESFGEALPAIEGKSVKGRRFVIKRFAQGDDFSNCQILYISSAAERRLRQVFSFLKDRPVLTVASFDGFAEAGGGIQLKKVDNKIRLLVNVEATKRAGLKMSSQLLEIAELVGGKTIREVKD